jgi:hypothetical protein
MPGNGAVSVSTSAAPRRASHDVSPGSWSQNGRKPTDAGSARCRALTVRQACAGLGGAVVPYHGSPRLQPARRPAHSCSRNASSSLESNSGPVTGGNRPWPPVAIEVDAEWTRAMRPCLGGSAGRPGGHGG